MQQRKLKKHLQKWLILMYAQLALIEGNRRLKAGHQGIKKEHNKGCSIIMSWNGVDLENTAQPKY